MADSALTVRDGTADDYDAIAALQREIQATHAEAWPRYFVPPSPTTLTRETFDGWLAAPNRKLLVATLAGRIIGHAWLVLHDRPANSIRPAIVAVEIDQLCVTASERGRGYGHRLLVEAEGWSRTRGANVIELSVWQFNREVIAVYERDGFIPMWQRMSRVL